MKKHLWTLALLPILCLLMFWLLDTYFRWAGEVHIPEETPMENEQTYVIVEHGALHLDDLGMGYVGIGYGETEWQMYVDEQGKTRRGHVAWLDMVTSERPSSSGPSSRQVVGVHAGQEISFGGYKLKVVNVWDCGSLFQGRYCVRLVINPDGTQGMPATPESSETPHP